jgi:UDP-N-acetyl-D-glucosamine 2-epimerase, UDP-hydrolysing
MRKICFVTGTRAEYGLLSRLMRLVKEDNNLRLQVIATNMHLMPEYGETYKEIEKDGFTIDKKVYMHKPSDDAHGIILSMAEEMQGMNDALSELKPDILVLLGDRYEILVAAQVALIHRVPIAHIHGGEVTEGAFDDAIRHSVTKMSSLHFTSCEEYRHRVIQMGEQPSRVFDVGSLGVENIKAVPLMTKDELEASLDFKIDTQTILVTYHPVTLGGNPAKDIREFLDALDQFKELKVIFTMPNSDTGRDAIALAVENYVKNHSNRAKAYTSLGLKRYLSTLQFVKAAVGNSSSGIIEVPSFGIPTLNIGDRQKGRLASKSVVNCGTSKDEVIAGLKLCLSEEMQKAAKTYENPYAKPDTANLIYQELKNVELAGLNLKTFYDL